MKNFVQKWNNSYPLDYWYRRKFNIRFGSKEHLEISFLEMLFEWEQYKQDKEFANERDQEKERKERYEKNGFLEPRDLNLSEDFFKKKLDLSKFNDK